MPTALLAKLRGPGWQLPDVLPGGLTLYSAALSSTPNGQVVALSYSDGLFEVSLFVQRGALAPRMAGWQQVKIAGRQVYVAARGLSWSGHGYVYTMLVDAPPQTVTADVAALPHDTPPGFWKRLGHGLNRLARMADPFR
jgi:sigma-E factor negative regulatory protein RseB